jgi:HD-like signal output (HDOD) protein
MKNQEIFLNRLNKLLESDQGTLPVFSAVSLKIQLELIKDHPDLKVIEKFITEDQSLSSTVLRIANSVKYCGLIETTTVKSAIVRLGMAEIMQIVCTDINNKMFSSHDAAIDAIMKRLWQHSVGCAFSAGILANTLSCGVLQDEAFSAGLFHDIGKLFVLKIIDDKKNKKYLGFSDDYMLEVIESLHAKQGYRLMTRMKLPRMYAVVARDHHQHKYDRDNPLLVLVKLANNICHQLGIGLVANPSLDIMTTEEAALLNLTEPILEKLRKFLMNNPNFAGL